MKKNKAAQELAKKRHLSLTPERRSEIASLAGKKSAENRRQKRDLTESEKAIFQSGVENVA